MAEYVSKQFIKGWRYAFSENGSGRSATRVTLKHPGPTGKECAGKTVYVPDADMPQIRQGRAAIGLCYGCGWLGVVTVPKSE